VSVRVGDIILAEVEVLNVTDDWISVTPNIHHFEVSGILRQAFKKGDWVKVADVLFEIRAIDGNHALGKSIHGHTHIDLSTAVRVDD
jgi:hypothetical protein